MKRLILIASLALSSASPLALGAVERDIVINRPSLGFGLEVDWRADVPAPSAAVADSWINAAGGAGATYIALDAATTARSDVKDAFAAASERGSMKFFPATEARAREQRFAAETVAAPEALAAAEARAVASGRNLLLTAAPGPDGSLPMKVSALFAAAKPWAQQNKETLYGATAGALDGLPDGVVATRRDGTLFLHVLDTRLADVTIRPDREFACAAAYADGADIPIVRLADGRIRLAVPRKPGDSFDVVLKLVPKLENPFTRLSFFSQPPRPAEVPRFCRFIREHLAKDGFDTLFVQGGYGSVRHPECHAPSNFLTKVHTKMIADTCREVGIRVVPALETLSHMGKGERLSYILRSHPELDESRGFTNLVRNYSRCLCPRHPETLPLVTDLAIEIAEAYGSDEIHITCDEVFEIGRCPRCKGTPTDVLFADYVNALTRALKARGIKKVTMWGDRLIDYRLTCLGDPYESSDNGTHLARGKVDRDIVIGDWRYYLREAYPSVDLFGEAGYTMWASVWNESQAAERFVAYAKEHDRGHVCGVMLTTWHPFSLFLDCLENRTPSDPKVSPKLLRSIRGAAQVYRAFTAGGREHQRHGAR